MSQDLATRFIGYAPDQRDRDNPPEVVYWTENRPRPKWYHYALAAWGVGGCAFFILNAAVYAFTGIDITH